MSMSKRRKTKRGTWGRACRAMGRWGRRALGGERGAKPELDVVTQLGEVVRQPGGALIGAIAGGSVPYLAQVVAHGELPQAWRAGDHALAALMVLIVLGAATFSMLTVAKFGMAAFGDRRKAVGFVLALEGFMLVTRGAASAYALLLLVLVNAITNGCHIAVARAATLRRRAQDARRQATAAETRARQRAERAATATHRAPAPSSRESDAGAPRTHAPVHVRATLARPAQHPRPARRAPAAQADAVTGLILWSPINPVHHAIDADFE